MTKVYVVAILGFKRGVLGSRNSAQGNLDWARVERKVSQYGGKQWLEKREGGGEGGAGVEAF